MAEIDPKNGFRFNYSKIEILPLEKADPGVDYEWINRTTFADRARALELLRWHAYGKEQCMAEIKRVIEIDKLPDKAAPTS